MKKAFWKRDWFFGLVITFVFLIFANSALILGFESALYDLGVRSSTRDPGDKIAVIAIDDESIANIGRWPWSRDILASMISRLAESGAKVIANTILLSEPQIDPGLSRIDEALVFFDASGLSRSRNPNVVKLQDMLKDSRIQLDTDTKLANSMQQAGNVIMSMIFNLSSQGYSLGKLDEELPDYIGRNVVKNITGDAAYGGPFAADGIFTPIEQLGQSAAGIGHLNLIFDVDGSVRTELLAVDYYGNVFPSLALLAAAKSLNLVRIERGKSVNLGKLTIHTDANTRMYPFFYQSANGKAPFTEDSFYDVHQGKIPIEKYKGKIVLIGATAAGIGSPLNTPMAQPIQPAMLLAHITASILNQDFFIVPEWATNYVQGRFRLAFLLVAVYLILILPRLKAGMAALISFLLFFSLLGTSLYLMISSAMWVQLMMPASLLFSGYLLMITKRFLVTERGMIKSEEASAESNRMLGLAFQQQGQLDMALEKFRKCPLDDSMMEPFYNLALDVMFGAAGANPAAATMILDGDNVQKPMLGRYEVQKELGKGAMGVVYLGKDPKINREVAIKTMALSQEFEEDELDEVKERFFREAETAGRLVHPNIVSIYDAGEEHDLAYIAMEFLKGHDLMRYTKKDNLLPVPKVIDIIVMSAEGLGYAHKQNVVHRDVKPANIMYEPEEDKIKITDFGIARITDSSKTKTGMILGTPSYMSPEQLQGKKIDGRSDLFSLGVMFYQMLCGDLPFSGDSMATLMFKIANDPHPNVIDTRPELAEIAPSVVAIIDKALVKLPEERYQTGEEMVEELKECSQSIHQVDYPLGDQ
jgi:serine/threonine-protein kinase